MKKLFFLAFLALFISLLSNIFLCFYSFIICYILLTIEWISFEKRNHLNLSNIIPVALSLCIIINYILNLERLSANIYIIVFFLLFLSFVLSGIFINKKICIVCIVLMFSIYNANYPVKNEYKYSKQNGEKVSVNHNCHNSLMSVRFFPYRYITSDKCSLYIHINDEVYMKKIENDNNYFVFEIPQVEEEVLLRFSIADDINNVCYNWDNKSRYRLDGERYTVFLKCDGSFILL